MKFGEKISYQRDKKGLSVADFAKQVGLSADTIKQYQKKEMPEGIDIMKIKRIADYCEISVDYFLYHDDEDEQVYEIENYKYLNKIDVPIDIQEFANEIKSFIKHNDTIINGKNIEDEKKKYLIDSIDIGIKLTKQNV